jgi:hypothetical protein
LRENVFEIESPATKKRIVADEDAYLGKCITIVTAMNDRNDDVDDYDDNDDDDSDVDDEDYDDDVN